MAAIEDLSSSYSKISSSKPFLAMSWLSYGIPRPALQEKCPTIGWTRIADCSIVIICNFLGGRLIASFAALFVTSAANF